MAQLSEEAVVARLYDRFGFGAGGGDLSTAQRAGLDASLTALLTHTGPDAGAAKTPAPELAVLRRPGRADGAADPDAMRRFRQQNRQQQAELTSWWLDRMVLSEHPMTERLTWFWHGHFATSVQKVKSAALMLGQNESIRRLGRTTVRALTHAMVVDPAMLVWLDGNDNTVEAPNENLSREFLELFAVGRGAYTETDVRQAARALTGWRVVRETGAATFRARQHDDGEKSLFGAVGRYDAEGLVDLTLDQPAAATFLVSRLWFRLVSATPPDLDAQKALTAAYGRDGDVEAVLRAIVRQPAFADPASSLVKQPVEWLVGLLRALQVAPGALEPRVRRRLLASLRGMGQVPFAPPSVGGWAAGGGWLTTAATLSRMQVARLVVAEADLDGAVGSGPGTGRGHRQRLEQVRRLLGVERFSGRTAQAIAEVSDLRAAVAVGACSPEYVVSR